MNLEQIIDLGSQSTKEHEEHSEDLQKNTLVSTHVIPLIKKQRKSQKVGVKQKKLVSYEYIPLMLRENHVFYLNGDFIISIYPNENNNYYNMSMNQITNYTKYVQLDLPTHQSAKEFDLPISLLESSQCLRKYDFAQQLKKFKYLQIQFQEQFEIIKQYYMNELDNLDKLNYERSQFRKQLINKYIKENLKDDDFYSIAEKGQNFEFMQLEIKSLTLSKALFALIGVEEKDINSYLLHVGLGDYVFLSEQETFYGAVLDLFLKNERNKNIQYKDFIILTLDNIKLYCDVDLYILDINYPEHLQFKSQNDPNLELDCVIIFKYDVQFYHLQRLIEYRQQNKFDEEQQSNSQSLEYSLLSSIFIDKYYPESKCKLLPEYINKNKECGYRVIV